MEAALAHDPDPLRVHCPLCGKKTDRIQGYEAPLFLSLIVYYVWNTQHVVGCPRCVRSGLFKRALLAIPMSNIMCPLIIPWYVALIASSYGSDKPGIPDKYRSLAILNPHEKVAPTWQGKAEGRSLRLVVALLILAAVIGIMFFVLPRLTAYR